MLHKLKHYKHLNLNNEILIKDTVREMGLKEAWRAASTMIIIAIQYTVLQVLSACLDSGNIITLFSQINNSQIQVICVTGLSMFDRNNHQQKCANTKINEWQNSVKKYHRQFRGHYDCRHQCILYTLVSQQLKGSM